MGSYFVAQINIHDQVAYNRYLEGFDAIFAQYNGEVLAVDDHVQVLEGSWPYQRTVIIKFPDQAALLRWYKSDAYQKLARIRHGAADANIVVVNG